MAGRSGGPDSKVVKDPNVKITSKGSSTYQAAAARQRRVNEKLPKKSPPRPCNQGGVVCHAVQVEASQWKPRGQLKHPKVRGFFFFGTVACPTVRYCRAVFVLHDRKPRGRQR